MLNPAQARIVSMALRDRRPDEKRRGQYLQLHGVRAVHHLSPGTALFILAMLEGEGWQEPGRREDYWRLRYIDTLPASSRARMVAHLIGGERLPDMTSHDLSRQSLFPNELMQEIASTSTAGVPTDGSGRTPAACAAGEPGDLPF